MPEKAAASRIHEGGTTMKHSELAEHTSHESQSKKTPWQFYLVVTVIAAGVLGLILKVILHF
jgi:hypothetical protein